MALSSVRVSPTERAPTHHISLTGPDTEIIGLVLCDPAGNPDPTQLASQPYPRTAIKTYSGASDLSSEEPPYNPISQSSWSGGLGKLTHDEDATRYREAHGINTSYADRAFLQGRIEHTWGGYRNIDKKDMSGVTFYFSPTATYNYIADSFVASATYNVKYIQVHVKKTGAPTSGLVKLGIATDDSGYPGTITWATDVPVADLNTKSTENDDLTIICGSSFGTPYALTGGTTYWIVVKLDFAASAACYQLATDTDDQSGGCKSLNGTSWVAGGPGFYYCMREDLTQFDALFLHYNHADYMITQPVDKGASKLYISGDRGVADSNSGNLDKLIDASKTWKVNAFTGGYVWLLAGPGAADERPFRRIVSNTSTQLVVDKNWPTEHTTKTEYVIVGSDYWTYLGSWGDYVYAATPVYNRIYVAAGNSATYGSYEWSVNGSTFEPRETWRAEADYLSKRTDWIVGVPNLVDSTIDNACTTLYSGVSSNHEAASYDAAYTAKAVALGGAPETWGKSTEATTVWLKEKLPMGNSPETNELWSAIPPQSYITHGIEHGVAWAEVTDQYTTGTIAGKNLGTDGVLFKSAPYIAFSIKSTVALASGDLQYGSATTVDMGTVTWVDLPAMDANQWHFFTVAHGKKEVIKSIGFNMKVDKGALKLYIGQQFWLCLDSPLYVQHNPMLLPNKVVLYSGSQDGTTTVNPWYFMKNGEIWERQTQSGDVMVRLKLEDAITQGGPQFGNAATQHGLYLFFNVGRKLQRYYNNQVDDIGPDRDEGLPDLQKGAYPYTLMTYPGRLYASYYGGNSSYQTDAGHSAIYVQQNNGWCEAVRSIYGSGAPIRNMGIQTTPGGLRYLMWVEGGLVLRSPISFDPLQEPGYIYKNDGVLITGRYYAGRRDIEKFYKSLKLTADNLSATVKITAYYRTDTDTAWQILPALFDESPFKEIDLSAYYDVTGRWIQFRLDFATDTSTTTPVLYGLVIDTMIRVPVKDAYNITFRLGSNEVDIQGNAEILTAKQKYNILRGWLAGARPVTMATLDELTNGMVVYPEPIPIRKLHRAIEEGGQLKDIWVCSMTLLEV